MEKNKRFLLMLLLLIGCIEPLRAQRIAVSTNAAEILTLTPNIETEFSINHKRSFAIGVDINPFEIDDKLSFKHLSVTGEYRFWIDQIFYAHYVSAVVQISSNDFDISRFNLTMSGDMCALGVGYGYSWIINRHLNIVPNISAGYGYDLSSIGGTPKFKPMLLNVGVSIQYLIK